MTLPQFTRTSVFRLTLIYAVLFAVSVALLFGVVYWSTIGFLERQTAATIEAEIQGLGEQYERSGLTGLVSLVAERVNRDEEGRSVYLFADARSRPLAGNLDEWPTQITATEGWVDFTSVRAGGQRIPMRARVLGIGPNLRLLVGRDIRELVAINRTLRDTLALGLGATLLLATAGGLLMSLSAERRVARINRTIRQIMAGDLSQRVVGSGGRDEYDELTGNINAMLAQIEALIGQIRHVGDSVAHDLRGPLTRLRNRLELLAASDRIDASSLDECVEQADALLDIFNALLRIARIESGAYRSAFAATDLSHLVQEVCSLFHVAAAERGIVFQAEITPGISVVGDRELLAQGLSNLLDNAIKYTPAGGTIVVTLACPTKSHARLTVADSGPGIPAADRERVLERFHRLDQARTLPGSGLGLSLVKAIVEQHRGTLELADNAPGLVVTIDLPLQQAGLTGTIDAPSERAGLTAAAPSERPSST